MAMHFVHSQQHLNYSKVRSSILYCGSILYNFAAVCSHLYWQHNGRKRGSREEAKPHSLKALIDET